ncbi:hypothetical protein B0H12DRAFT_356641 [Mycena haematopus]|nr:hypothetical protein B0H12DRAFT_356641 [Mycena haematopus]
MHVMHWLKDRVGYRGAELSVLGFLRSAFFGVSFSNLKLYPTKREKFRTCGPRPGRGRPETTVSGIDSSFARQNRGSCRGIGILSVITHDKKHSIREAQWHIPDGRRFTPQNLCEFNHKNAQ